MWYKFKCADTMCDVFDAITLAMCKVIHRVNAPVISCTMMMRMFDAVDDRIPHVHVVGSHINFGAQHFVTVLIHTIFHCTKQLKVFFNGPVPGGAILARLGWCTF